MSAFRIGIVNESLEGYVNVDRLGSLSPGLAVEVTQLVCRNLHLNCLFEVSGSGDYGAFIDGNWSGMLGDVSRGRYNTSLPVFSLPMLKKQKFQNFPIGDFSVKFPLHFAIRRTAQEELISLTALIRPLSANIWLTLLVTVGCLSALLLFTQSFRKGPSTSDSFPYRLVSTVVSVGIFLVRKGPLFLQSAGTASRIALLSWGISTVVLIATYTGGLLSSMFKTTGKLPFVDMISLANCIKADRCQLVVTRPHDDWFLQLLEDDNSVYQPLKIALQQRSYITVKNSEESFALITGNRGSKILAAAPDIPATFMKFVRSGVCPLVFIKDNSGNDDCYYPFSPADPSQDQFYGQLRLLHRSGLMEKMTKKYQPEMKCERDARTKRTTAPPVPLRLALGALVILLVGLIAAGLALMVEASSKFICGQNRGKSARK